MAEKKDLVVALVTRYTTILTCYVLCSRMKAELSKVFRNRITVVNCSDKQAAFLITYWLDNENRNVFTVISLRSAVLHSLAVWSADEVTSIVESGLNLHLRAYRL